jgi:hypothetical protein
MALGGFRVTKHIIILDLDNCIADDNWRHKFIREGEPDTDKKFHDYHSLALLDRPGNTILYFREYWPLKISELNPAIVISTARPEAWRTMTQHWLDINRIEINQLYMRADGDHRPATAIKLDNLKKILSDYGICAQQVIGAYDDRPDVIQMYRDAGILNAQIKFINQQEY